VLADGDLWRPPGLKGPRLKVVFTPIYTLFLEF